jgi:hypothetical protein
MIVAPAVQVSSTSDAAAQAKPEDRFGTVPARRRKRTKIVLLRVRVDSIFRFNASVSTRTLRKYLI